jgi:hypothetical protein
MTAEVPMHWLEPVIAQARRQPSHHNQVVLIAMAIAERQPSISDQPEFLTAISTALHESYQYEEEAQSVDEFLRKTILEKLGLH